MSSHRRNWVVSFRWWLLAGVAIALPLGAWARVQSSSIIDTSLLRSAESPAARAVPVHNPYFLGWSAEVTAPTGLLKYAREPGGVEIDVLGGAIYAGTRDGVLVCLAAGGEVKWQRDLGGSILAAPTVLNERVVVGTSEGVLYSLNKVTGELVGTRAILNEELITQPVVAEPTPGTLRAYVASSADSLFAIDLETGQKLWRAHRDPPSGFTVYGFARPILTPNAIYIAFADGVVEARNPENGSLLWEKHVSPPGDQLDVDSLAMNKQSLFAASYSGGVYALDLESGAIKWHTPMPGAARVVADGPFVYAGAPGQWIGMRAADGVTGWRLKVADGHATTPGVVGERYLVFAEADGPIYFVDKRTGEPAGLLSSGEGFASAPAAVGPVMAALSNGGRVYTLTVVP